VNRFLFADDGFTTLLLFDFADVRDGLEEWSRKRTRRESALSVRAGECGSGRERLREKLEIEGESTSRSIGVVFPAGQLSAYKL